MTTEELLKFLDTYPRFIENDMKAVDYLTAIKHRLRELHDANRWRPIGEAGGVQAEVTQWTLMPTNKGMGHFAISINLMQSPFYQGDRYAVRAMGGVLSVKGEWEVEPQPSSRDDAFYAAFRFSTFDDALKAAMTAAAKYKVNRLSVYDLPPATVQGGEEGGEA